ncbi:hypothetical protein PanWU01x14_188260, partial [Parasponia andersonii]
LVRVVLPALESSLHFQPYSLLMTFSSRKLRSFILLLDQKILEGLPRKCSPPFTPLKPENERIIWFFVKELQHSISNNLQAAQTIEHTCSGISASKTLQNYLPCQKEKCCQHT